MFFKKQSYNAINVPGQKPLQSHYFTIARRSSPQLGGGRGGVFFPNYALLEHFDRLSRKALIREGTRKVPSLLENEKKRVLNVH